VDIIAYHISITGVVQGVGFRPFVYNLAARMGLHGWVLNHSGGVDVEVEGPAGQLEDFITALRVEAPPLAYITNIDTTQVAPSDYREFTIRHSEQQSGRHLLVSPDVATCGNCLNELFDPNDRRYRYPFINCTNCGPRFTIIKDVPYDRPNTTMHVFPLCEDCAKEYNDPANRRFHAQPNACPVCGPQLWMIEKRPQGKPWEHRGNDKVLARAKELLLAGQILAVKGLGGFLLACDATNDRAVQLLRERKLRPHKPFAVMVASLEDAEKLCVVSTEEATLLKSHQCPIVLLHRHPDASVAEMIAPHTHALGVMLPYTPLHHLLLQDIGRPLVMTSGNLTEEPIAKDNAEALSRLDTLADAFILHNRDIYARYDDSVMQVYQLQLPNEKTNPQGMGSGKQGTRTIALTQPLRRARGYAPLPVALPFSLPQVFAAGPLLKNTFTLARDKDAFVSQHIGDLESIETLDHYEESLATYQHLFNLTPELVASDLHPDYLSTRFARQFAEQRGLPSPILVQHHHAHIASCLADNKWSLNDGPVIGVALDGTGYGEDGAIWGGEWFVGDYRGFRRAAHLEYLPLPGGDAAIHNPWRIAAAYVHTLLSPEDYPCGVFCSADAMMVREQIEHKINTPLTSSMGRLFDAVSALLGIREKASYEAQAAIELQQVAQTYFLSSPHISEKLEPYPFTIDDDGSLKKLRVAVLLDALLYDMEHNIPRTVVAARFHLTIAEMIVQLCDLLSMEMDIHTVALSGGVFQNKLLMETVIPRLSSHGLRVLTHQQVPCNDGGVSLGQAVMAGLAAVE
jgi:hydrogenase maturation protein HypF